MSLVKTLLSQLPMHIFNAIIILINLLLLIAVVLGVTLGGQSGGESDFRHVDRVINDAIADGAFPGAVILVASKSGILYQNAYGHHTYSPKSPKMTQETLFDMASVTKVIATTTAVAQLYQNKYIEDLDVKVGSIFPEFKNHGKESITLRHLLLHNSGFKPDPVPGFNSQAFACPETAKTHPQLAFSCIEKIYTGIMEQPLMNPVGAKYVYSDLSMMTAHLIVGKMAKDHKLVSDADLREDCPASDKGGLVCYYEAYVRKHVLESLGLKRSGFLPDPAVWKDCAPAWNESSTYRHELIQGYVSDPNAYANGGIMGHAGLFSTPSETLEVVRNWMYHIKPEYLNAETSELFRKVANVTQSSRALGWDTNSDGFGSCGHLSPSTYLHLGYTGTQVCNDPDRGIITMLFTNRVYPTAENTKIGKARSNFNDAVICSLEGKHCA